MARLPVLPIIITIALAIRLALFWQQPEYPRQFNYCPTRSYSRQSIRWRQRPVLIKLPRHFAAYRCYRLQGNWQFNGSRPVFTAERLSPLPKYRLDNLQIYFQKIFQRVQFKLADYYHRWLPTPEDSLLSGIVLGQKSQLSGRFHQALQRSGTIHIVVASGYNLTVISQRPVDFLANFIGRRPALGAGFLLVWGYAFLAGWQPPVIRAAIIISFIYLAQFIGRKFSIWPAFFAAAAVMLFINPRLIWSVSFQLSLAALAGILLLAPKFTALQRLPLVGKELSETLAAQILVLPIIAYHFSQISLVAPLANMLVLPLVPFLMEWGLLGLILGIIWQPLGLPFLWLSYPLLHFFTAVINWWGQWRFSQVQFHFGIGLMAVYYLLLATYLKWQNRRTPPPS